MTPHGTIRNQDMHRAKATHPLLQEDHCFEAKKAKDLAKQDSVVMNMKEMLAKDERRFCEKEEEVPINPKTPVSDPLCSLGFSSI
jgi:hypothetical protein